MAESPKLIMDTTSMRTTKDKIEGIQFCEVEGVKKKDNRWPPGQNSVTYAIYIDINQNWGGSTEFPGGNRTRSNRNLLGSLFYLFLFSSFFFCNELIKIHQSGTQMVCFALGSMNGGSK